MERPDNLTARGLSAATVRAQLARILRSPIFSNAPALSRLLEHVVESTLSNIPGEQLKEYTLGVEVFDRGEGFDPRTDTIVRVQARRLRAKLRDYYGTTGQFDPVRIEIPSGRYAADFTTASAAASASGQTAGPSEESLPPIVADPTGRMHQPLPAPRTRLVGRERELAALTRLLQDAAVRLVTLTGAGGSGKTRLALETAREVANHFSGGVLMLPLAPLADAAAVATALAQLVGVRQTGGRPVRDALRAYARHHITAPTLLFADNFEHVIEAAAVIVDLLDASPHVTVLATSRAVLHVYGEHEYAVPPLDTPDTSDGAAALSRNPAVQLFVQRACSVDRAFVLTDDNAPTVAAICRRLDGLPLAIELAAARIKLFPAQAMSARLAHSLDFLTGGPSDLPPRQQTLRSTIDWSHALLTEGEQRLFRRLAVLVGGWTLESAEAVCNPHRDLDIVQGIGSLADKSLVQHVDSAEGESRFKMLETLREYAMERLVASGDELHTRRAHAAYAIVLAEEGTTKQNPVERDAWLRQCDLELDNLRAGLDWLIARGDAAWATRLGLGLFPFWEHRELLEEGRQRLNAIVGMRGTSAPTTAWASAAAYLAAISDMQGDGEASRALFERALESFRAIGDKRGEAAQLNALAGHCHFRGQYASARLNWERTLAVCRELGEPLEIAAALSNLARAVSHEGDNARASALLTEACSIFEQVGDQVSATWSINHLGDVAKRRGDLTEANQRYQSALDGFTRLNDSWGIARSAADLAQVNAERDDYAAARTLFARALAKFAAVDHKRGIARVLEGFAIVAEREQQFARALTLAGAAAAIRERFGAVPRAVDQAAFEHSLAPAWQSCTRGEVSAAWEAGRRMPLEEAIRFALS